MSELEGEYPDDPRMIGEYRSFSFFSLLALLLAILSAIALVNPSFIPLPIIAAAIALGAVTSVELRETRPSGGFLGYLALFLATTIGSGTLSYSQLYEQHQILLAREFAEQWLELVRKGEVVLPYELTRENLPERQPFEIDLVKHYRELSTGGEKTLMAYKVLEPDLSIRRAGKDCTFEFLKVLGHDESQALRDLFILQYRLKWKSVGLVDGVPLDDVAAAAKKSDWIVSITMLRIDAVPPLGAQWVFKSINCDEPKFERKLPGFEVVE
ncbi:MAG: hypothetical protein ABL888_08190 [Pirellulaceae bacterium]